MESDPRSGASNYPRLMEMTALGPFVQRLAGRLSGGMKQKLGLACTLIRSPELLLLDEPTVGVDPLSRRELWAIILQLVNEQGLTVLLSTSYLDEAERCAHVVVLHEGRYWPRVVRTK
jgi:ABC-2 type transport system ATP-binding protein